MCTCADKAKCACGASVKIRVHDRSYFTDKYDINKKCSLTPEGFLLCESVPIARTGEQLYGPDETPIKPAADGIVRIDREANEVFRPETIASFEGKDVTDEHVTEGVSPSNWKQVTVGHVQNVRRGEGVDDEYLLADLIIKDPDAIKAVQSGKREVSCGYDAEYQETGPGRGRQYNIVGNHVALVERGRCGPRCSIKDEEFKTMAKSNKKQSFRDGLKKLFGVTSDAELNEKLDEEVPMGDAEGSAEGPEGLTVHNHVHMGGDAEPDEDGEDRPAWFLEHVAQNNARFDSLDERIGEMMDMLGGTGDRRGRDAEPTEEERRAAEEEAAHDAEVKEMEGEFEEEAPAGTGDKARKAKDSAYFADSFRETVAAAEILAPGIALPTYDSAAKPAATFKAICGLRRKALDKAKDDPALKIIINGAAHGRPLALDSMPCAAVRTLFFSASAAKKAANVADQQRVADSLGAAGGGLGVASTRKVKTIADLNKTNRDYYKGQLIA